MIYVPLISPYTHASGLYDVLIQKMLYMSEFLCFETSDDLSFSIRSAIWHAVPVMMLLMMYTNVPMIHLSEEIITCGVKNIGKNMEVK